MTRNDAKWKIWKGKERNKQERKWRRHNSKMTREPLNRNKLNGPLTNRNLTLLCRVREMDSASPCYWKQCIFENKNLTQRTRWIANPVAAESQTRLHLPDWTWGVHVHERLHPWQLLFDHTNPWNWSSSMSAELNSILWVMTSTERSKAGNRRKYIQTSMILRDQAKAEVLRFLLTAFGSRLFEPFSGWTGF